MIKELDWIEKVIPTKEGVYIAIRDRQSGRESEVLIPYPNRLLMACGESELKKILKELGE